MALDRLLASIADGQSNAVILDAAEKTAEVLAIVEQSDRMRRYQSKSRRNAERRPLTPANLITLRGRDDG